MKNLHKFIAVALTAVFAMAGSFNADAQFRFGVKAGANFNKMNPKNPIASINSDNGCGWQAGVMAEFQVPVIGICIDAALQYARMNGDLVTTDPTATDRESNNNNFFDIPVNLKYKFTLPVVSKFLAPMIYTGPDFAFRLGGDNDYFKTKSVQYGWNLGIGAELFNHLQISGGYCFGINNVLEKYGNVEATDGIKVRNNYWTVNAAWLF